MRIIETADEMRRWSLAQKAHGKTVGFVPTMGALHEGHASLVRASVVDNDVTVVSIFVNPTQFAPNEDFGKYPRTFETDRRLVEEMGAGVIYFPDVKAMYPKDYATYVNVEGLSEGLCGASRPIFFRGVATVVTKLFNAVLPDRAYFGQKDAQQCAVITRMACDLDMGVEIVEMPIVREPDGLAMSSRNTYLSSEEHERALCLSRALFRARARLEAGERDADALTQGVRDEMAGVRIDYVELVDAVSMRPVTRIENTVVLAVAAWVGDTRLIDNIKCAVPAGA
ncbi:MAG TPA: pantoate--beta-alanine ligase [Candidatus Hydrogenedentes bacterium]|nr:pantoate--beta-alanine ligase [Candidatus Hydrogenedentota bacterium]HPG65418.1 pantoate--beta-alanine ligase [Candidatus Hydrogenedentota bacterium]